MTDLKQKIENMFPKTWDEVPEQFRVVPFEQDFYLGGNGITKHIKHGRYQKVYSPISVGGKPVYLGKYPMMNEKQVLEVVDANTRAWNGGNGEWPSMNHKQRLFLVRKCVQELEKQKDFIVKCIMWETGKTLENSIIEFDRTIQYLYETCDYFAKQIKKWSKRNKEGKLTFKVTYNAAGRVISMGPANYPFNETLQLIIPLLLTGNVIIFKPAKFGVLLFAPIIKCFDAILPKGVVTSVYGDGKKVIPPIVKSGQLEYFAFIGGTGTADAISKNIPNPHQVLMFEGLGAKNPIYALKGCDLKMAVRKMVQSGITNNNAARCTAGKDMVVEDEIFESFVQMAVEEVNNIKFGMPWEQGVTNTPLLPGTISWMQTLIDDAVSKGAKIMNECGGMINQGYMHPVILTDVTPDMLVCTAEQFCPVMPIRRFKGKEGLNFELERIKKLGFGQQVSIMAREKEDAEMVEYIDQFTKNQCCQLNICETGKRYDKYAFAGRGLSGHGAMSLSHAVLMATFPHVTVVDESYYE